MYIYGILDIKVLPADLGDAAKIPSSEVSEDEFHHVVEGIFRVDFPLLDRLFEILSRWAFSAGDVHFRPRKTQLYLKLS